MANIQYDYAAIDTLIKDNKLNYENSDKAFVFILKLGGTHELAYRVCDRLKQVVFYKGVCSNLN
jgi:hypothetical protein